MKIKTLSILAVATMCAVSSCDQTKSKYYDSRLKLQNNTNTAIVAYYIPGDVDTLADTYPSTIEANNLIAAPGTQMEFVRGGTWETAFRDDMPNGKMTMFVLDKSITDNTPWDSIRVHHSYLKRFELTIDSLHAHNYLLTVD